MTIEVYEPGLSVKVGCADGLIESVNIKVGGYTAYFVKWWDGLVCRDGWFSSQEIKPIGEPKKIGICFTKGTHE